MNTSPAKPGYVYLVGAGPGDPGLITVRAMDLISSADVIVYDNLIPKELLEAARADATLTYVGKRQGLHTMDQEQINELLVEAARSGSSVVRLKGGDPFVFGRGGEEALVLAAAGIRFEVVPGVTAAVAAAAYAGIPITHRKLASNAVLITGHECQGKEDSDLDYESLARSRGTLTFYMGVLNMERICTNLVEHGLDGDTPAAAVQWGTTPKQRVLVGTVNTLPTMAKETNLRPPAIIIIGEVVRLREELDWFQPPGE
jgi:uroporphyrinogen III methyltransferase/synthase